MDVYQHCVDILLAGGMPVVIPIGDELHVLTVAPTDRTALISMFHPSEERRLLFHTRCAVTLRAHCTA